MSLKEFLGSGVESVNPTVVGNSSAPVDPNMQTPEQLETTRVNAEIAAKEEQEFSAPENTFDYKGAQAEGYSDEEILTHLGAQGTSFDYQGAKTEGYSDEEIRIHLEDKAKTVKARKEVKRIEKRLGHKLANSDFALGVARSMTGISQTGNDILRLIGVRDDEEYAKRAEEVQSWTKDYVKAVQDDDLLSVNTLGQIVPSLAVLPVAVESKLALFTTESFIGYTEARATEDKSTSAMMGVATGALSVAAWVGINKVIEKLSAPAKKNVFDHYRNQMNYTTEEADAIYKDWLKTMEPSGVEYADRTRALIDYAGDKGAAIKSELARRSSKAQKVMDEGRATRIRTMKDLTNIDVDVEDIASHLSKQVGIVKDNYSKVKWEISNSHKSVADLENAAPRLDIPEAFDEATTGDRAAIVELLGKEANPTAIDMIEAMPHVNTLLSRAKGTYKNKWDKVKTQIESNLKDLLTTEDYIKWKTVNYDYREMSKIQASKIGEALDRVFKGGKKSNITPARALEIIKADKDSGAETFQAFSYIIGNDKKAAQLEELVLKQAFDLHEDKIIWDTLAKSLETKGFVNPSSQALVSRLDDIAKSFRTDDELKAVNIRMRDATDQGGIGYHLGLKLKVMLASKVFRMITQIFSKDLAMSGRLLSILKNPSKMKEFDRAVNTLSPGVKQRMVQQTIEELPALLEHKPRNVIKAKIQKDNAVLPTSQASKGMNSKAMQNAATQWVRANGIAGVEGNKVVEQVFKQFDNPRFYTRLDKVAKSLQAGREAQNAKKLQAVITNEAEQMAKAISRDSGVKVSPQMMDDLIKHVTKNMTGDCN